MSKTLCFGELLWDIIGNEKKIGGAPFNVAAHLAKLGCDSHIISAVGDDELGRESLAYCVKLGVNTDLVSVLPGRNTGTAVCTLNASGSATYAFDDNAAYDYIPAKNPAKDYDALCFGSLAQMNPVSSKALGAALCLGRFGLIVYDVNIRRDFYPADMLERSFAASNIVKFNDEELLLIPTRLYGREMDAAEFSAAVKKDFNVDAVVVTEGGKGCTVASDGKATFVAQTAKVTVVDTIGAGDAFCAAFIDEYLRTRDAVRAAEKGNQRGALVCSMRGAVPDGI